MTKVREVGTAATMGPCVLVILRVKLACIDLLGMSFYFVKKNVKLCMNLMSGSILVSQSKERTKNRKRHKYTNNYAALLYNN